MQKGPNSHSKCSGVHAPLCAWQENFREIYRFGARTLVRFPNRFHRKVTGLLGDDLDQGVTAPVWPSHKPLTDPVSWAPQRAMDLLQG